MTRDTDQLIAGLVDTLQPASPLRFSRGAVLAFGGLVLAIGLAVLQYGIRPDLMAGHPHAMFILAGGLFLLLGLACTVATVAMSNPRVGSDRNGWGWAAATASLLPLSALAIALIEGQSAWLASEPDHGVICLGISLGLGLIFAAILVSWLRRGAPASPERAGLLTGIAAGCAGVVAFTFVCPINSIMHIGLWHGLAVTLGAMAGRLVVPHLVRW
ncbi:MAG: DUF1109 domain-containing protein [Novosphingobium sp.]|nr:DUF1109 domain-containing protein [Novosphingobium sp.]